MMQSDGNTKDIVAKLRDCGASVFYWKAISRTRGVPDLIVGYGGVTYLLEVKTSTGKLSDKQVEWHRAWKGGPIAVVRSPEAAMVAVGIEPAF